MSTSHPEPDFPGTAAGGQRFEPYTTGQQAWPLAAAVSRPDTKTYFRTLTGYDEIAITQQFGRDLGAMRATPFDFMRALVFTDLRRQGVRDPEAKEQVLGMTMGELEDYFPEKPSPEELGKDKPAS